METGAHFNVKEKTLEEAFQDSVLPTFPRTEEIRDLLHHIIDRFYGPQSIQANQKSIADKAIQDIKSVLTQYRLWTIYFSKTEIE